MRKKNLDLIAAVIIAAANVVWAVLPGHIPAIGTLLAVPLVIILPGYTLAEALFYRWSLDISQRLLFSLGLSLTIVILGGLILNLLPLGLQRMSWAVLLALLTVIFSLWVAYLRRGVPLYRTESVRFRFSIYGYILLGFATIVAIFSVSYAGLGVALQPHPGFTQLWMLPVVQTGKSCVVRLGVRSFESTTIAYSVMMTKNGAELMPSTSVVLKPEQEWRQLVSITPVASNNIYIEAQLYRLDIPGRVYRKVNLTFPNSPGSKGGNTRPCGTPQIASGPYPVLASRYNGTINDITSSLTTKLSLSSIRQSQRNINGYFVEGSRAQIRGSFRGTVTTKKQIQFTVANDTGRAILSLEGNVRSDGLIAGSYCALDQRRRCSSKYGYGLWSVAPS